MYAYVLRTFVVSILFPIKLASVNEIRSIKRCTIDNDNLSSYAMKRHTQITLRYYNCPLDFKYDDG